LTPPFFVIDALNQYEDNNVKFPIKNPLYTIVNEVVALSTHTHHYRGKLLRMSVFSPTVVGAGGE